MFLQLILQSSCFSQLEVVDFTSNSGFLHEFLQPISFYNKGLTSNPASKTINLPNGSTAHDNSTWMGDHQGRPSAPTNSLHKLHLERYQVHQFNSMMRIVVNFHKQTAP